MISYSESLSAEILSALPQNSIKTRILAMLTAYGTGFDFLDFWLQKNEKGTTAAICRFSGEVWLVANEDADHEELRSFCGVIAPALLCEQKTARHLGLDMADVFWELALSSPENKPEQKEVDLQALYDALTLGADGDILISDKDEWYADVSHRLRHGTAAAVITENSAALAGFVTDTAALITGVVTDPAVRGKGFAKDSVERLCRLLSGKRVYAEAREDKAAFYEKCGFEKTTALARCRTN